jgi:hypothetical protein
MPFFLPNTEQASLYLLSSFLPDKENDTENILYTGKEDAHDGAQVSLQSRVAGYYTVIPKFNHRRRCFYFP